MSMPLSCRITDIFGEEWVPNQDGRIRLKESPTGILVSAFEYDEYAGPGMAGVVVIDRIDKVNVIGCKFYVDGPKGQAGRDLLVEFIRGHGRGFARQPSGELMKFEVEDSGRFQMVRASIKSEPELVKMHAVGRAYQEIEYRSDETWWRTDPVVESFTAAQFSGAAVANFGDEPSWPHYRIDGPLNGGAIGLLGEDLTLPNLSAGQWLEINTDPDRWEVRDQAGVDRSDDINGGDGNRWHTLAPVGDDPIPVTITGTGTTSATRVTVTVPQLFWSAL